MSSAATAEEIARDAHWLAQALDPTAQSVRLVAMDRESYRAASFLDDRLIQQPLGTQIIPWLEIEAAASNILRTDARWIFHIGHVGSTLISRLIGDIRGVLAVREPRLLRDLALTPADIRRRYMGAIPKLMSRTFGAHETACVKATSFASEIAPELVPTGERALFMYATPRNYIATILAGENSLKELRALEPYRAQRLATRRITFAPARSDADRAAAAWACEMSALEAAAKAMVDRRVDWANFDDMLADVPRELGRAALVLGLPADEEELAAIASGPLMRRYSKDANYKYSPKLRYELIHQELRLRGREIDAALAMLAAVSERSPLLANGLSRAKGT